MSDFLDLVSGFVLNYKKEYISDFLDLVSGFVLNYKKEHMSLIFLIWFQVLS